MISTIGIRPIRDQVLVRQDPPSERHSSGLYLPDSAVRDLQEDLGAVLGVGPGVTEVWPGDRVLFKRRPGSALVPDSRLGGDSEWIDVLMLREDDIIGIIED